MGKGKKMMMKVGLGDIVGTQHIVVVILELIGMSLVRHLFFYIVADKW